MRRREFIVFLGTAAILPAAAPSAQERVRRIGVLLAFAKDDLEDQRRRAALQEGLRQLGWTEGRNLSIEYRSYGGEPKQARAMAKELVALQPDLIVAAATPGLMAALAETRTIPIVFIAVSDPIGQGLVASLAQPGGNATGFTYLEFSVGGKLLEILKQIAPGVTRVGLVYNPETGSPDAFLPAIESAAPSLGIELVKVPVRTTIEIETAIGEMAQAPGTGLLFPPDTFTNTHRELIVALAARYRVPAIYILRPFATAGGLMSYGADVTDLYRRAPSYVDRILRGAKPADLPVQQPTKFELVINLKTAKALGLTVPQSLLAQADEVIE